MNINITNLIAKAKAHSKGREKNKGRPRLIMGSEEASIVSKMRQNRCSVKSIHSVMVGEKLTELADYQKFANAYKNYKLWN